MKVTINGEIHELPDGVTVGRLLEHLELSNRRVAVEINRELVTRSLHQTRIVNPDDVVEIVSLVGGG